MARNYVEFYSSRLFVGGGYVTFVREEQQDCIDAANAYHASFGGTIDWNGVRGYFLINAANVCALMQSWTTHYGAAGASAWVFLQDQTWRALASPRETWSHGE